MAAVILEACSGKQTLFTQLSSGESGIHFRNEIGNNTGDQSLISEFSYMGGGVGIGDFNKDGLKDIVFSGNQVSCALYLNKGENRFENITEKAALQTSVWATGVSVVDINQDGYDDIYICVYGKDLLHRFKNLLFINQHNLTFKEEAEEYGLADMSYSTQAAFFDYDKDGDLDMYLLNYRLNGSNGNFITPIDRTGNSPANDRLYRNDGDTGKKGHPWFTDVTIGAGIKEDGFGLGVSVSDFNGDNWPDIYVSNDFVANDELWLNNRNGTFTNRAPSATRHQGYSGMGSDAADINNDGLPDAATLDMMPEYNDRKKLSFSFMNYERYQMERSMGYEPEFMRNMLQLNNGNRISGDTMLPFFSEIGQLAGISETDWSWSILAADFNNDGWKDFHITNGIGRDYINADFLQFSENLRVQGYGDHEKKKVLNERLASIKPVELGNYLYLNRQDYTFSNYSKDAGIDEKSLSGGAAYADLDNDGDLDLVVNNINREAFVFVNNTVQTGEPVSSHFMRITLAGEPSNRGGFGARVFVYSKAGVQMQEQFPVRGYLSSVDQTLVFGMGTEVFADSILVVWPNDRQQTILNVKTNGTLSLRQADAQTPFVPALVHSGQLFRDVTRQKNVDYKHLDVPFNDFAQQRLLPQKYSQLGPFVTSADINNDGLADFYAGGGFNSTGRLFVQQPGGSFVASAAIPKDVMQEEADCLFFDADKDGDNDLLVTYGDMRFEDTSRFYRPMLFLNDGKGKFTPDDQAIPESVKTIAGCVRAADFDNDGLVDLFIGGRVSHQYPKSPASFLLKNTGGVFTDVTKTVCPPLEHGGIISAATWADIDQDRTPELIIAGEWMPVRIFKMQGGILKEITKQSGLDSMSGMWRSLVAADVDQDGDMDIVAGNLGENCRYHATPTAPMKLFAKDIDGNGSLDPVPFYYIRNRDDSRQLFPAINKDQLAEQVPAMKKQFLQHKTFSTATLDDIFRDKSGITELTCSETASCYFENMGGGKFIKHLLPPEAQFAPVNAIICDDLDGDGFNDLLLAGNEYQTEVMTGRYDASYGLFLKGSKEGFKPVSPVKSGFLLDGDVRSLTQIRDKNNKMVIAGVNNDSIRVFTLQPSVR